MKEEPAIVKRTRKLLAKMEAKATLTKTEKETQSVLKALLSNWERRQLDVRRN